MPENYDGFNSQQYVGGKVKKIEQLCILMDNRLQHIEFLITELKEKLKKSEES